MQFHPLVHQWFSEELGKPTPAQRRGWESIRQNCHTLIAAPTGSGKTLAAFLVALNDLFVEGLAGPVPDEVRVVYVSPLKALSTDIHKNLSEPRRGIRNRAEAAGLCAPRITAAVRTGDTTQAERAAMVRTPPHILVTTPESLYLLLTSDRSRRMLRTVRTVIVDEIHAVIGTRRGAHLALSLERLRQVAEQPILRLGLSATQKPIEDVARFLVGTVAEPCAIVDEGHWRNIDLNVEIPLSPLDAVMSHEVWEEYYDRLAALIREHKTTLIFVNTRRLSERLTRHLCERLGENAVTAHHGSLSKERRVDAETRLKTGQLQALVATASLELGIDIGHIDLVCQIGSPHRIATLLQRVGRSGHTVSGLPKGRLFPVSRDDLVECAALLRSVKRGELDAIVQHDAPADVLAQQIVAESTCRECGEAELYSLVRRAWPYRELTQADFDAVVRMTAEGFSTRRGRRAALVHRDEVNGTLRARRGTRLLALTSGGAIPEIADYRVVLEPEETFIGTLNEDFAIESMAGDIFQLGNASWRVLQVTTGTVRVADAKGSPPNIPFWFGEAPARSHELSRAVSDLRADIERRLAEPDRANEWLVQETGLLPDAALQAVDYFREGHRVLGVVPTQETLVLERFFDESGGMQLVTPRAVRKPDQQGMGSRAAKALLPTVQLRAAGGGDRGRAAPIARTAALVSVGGRVSLPASREHARHPGAGVSRRAGLSNALAVEHHDFARGTAKPRRTQGRAAAAAHAGRRSDGGRFPRRRRVSGKYSRRSRNSRSSARQPDRSRLPAGGDGFRRASRRARSDPSRRAAARGARYARTVAVRARDPQRAAVRVSRRRSARGTKSACRADTAGRRTDRCRRPGGAGCGGDCSSARRGAAHPA